MILISLGYIYGAKRKMTIKELKKEIEHIVLSDIGKADKVNKLWDFFIDNVDIIKDLKE